MHCVTIKPKFFKILATKQIVSLAHRPNGKQYLSLSGKQIYNIKSLQILPKLKMEENSFMQFNKSNSERTKNRKQKIKKQEPLSLLT